MTEPLIKMPSRHTMRDLCPGGYDNQAIPQILCLLIGLTMAFFVFFSLPTLFGELLSLFFNTQALSKSQVTFFALLDEHLTQASVAATFISVMTVAAAAHARSNHGSCTFYAEIQTDLSQAQALEYCRAVMQSRSVDGQYRVSKKMDRLIALCDENSFHETFVEVVFNTISQDQSLIQIRGISIVKKQAALFSAFYSDFGACRESGRMVFQLFSPYASRRRRPVKAVVRAVRPVAGSPPPVWQKATALQ